MENLIEQSSDSNSVSDKNVVSTNNLEYPSLVTRIQAIVVDSIVILIVFILASYILDILGEIPDSVRGFILIFMLFLYDPILTSLTAGTLGHKVMGLKVICFSEKERKLSVPRAIIRSFVKGVLGWISFFTVTGNREKRAIHDIISGSIVLKK